MAEEYISVVMSTYREPEALLRQAIESILNQTYSNFEYIIVLDDPAESNIETIVQQYARADSRIRIIKHERNCGLTASLNDGIQAAKGNLIARMDADDISMPDRLEKELEILLEYELDLVASSKMNIDECGHNLGIFVNDFSPERIRALLPWDNSINHPSVLMRKSVVEALGGYRDIAACEDYDLWLRMLCSGYRMMILPDILLHYRVRKSSITRTDKYRQYLSERFVHQMYREYKNTGKLLTLEEYRKFIEMYGISEKKRTKFNRAYEYLSAAFELRAAGSKLLCSQLLLKAVLADVRMWAMIKERVMYHVRKKVVCRRMA